MTKLLFIAMVLCWLSAVLERPILLLVSLFCCVVADIFYCRLEQRVDILEMESELKRRERDAE